MSDLGLHIVNVKRAGVQPPAIVSTRELTDADLTALAAPGRNTQTAPLRKLRDSHHSLARLCAEGQSNEMISAILGISSSRISILRCDPAFVELVEFYRGQKAEVLADVELRMKAVLKDTVEELHERLQDNPEAFTVDELHAQAKLFADRTGHGPSSKQQVDVRFGIADRLEAARKRANQARLDSRIIDLEIE